MFMTRLNKLDTQNQTTYYLGTYLKKKAKRVDKVSKEENVPESKKWKRSISSYYVVESGKLKRALPFCERCGPGYFMADHGNRFSCGHCGFTRYKQKSSRSPQ